MQLPDPAPDLIDRVELRVPAVARAAATLRVLAASLAADAGFSFDDIDDIRLALNELFTSCTTERPTDRIVAVMSIDGEVFSAEIARESGEPPTPLDDLAVKIVSSITDSFESSSEHLRIVKRAARASDSL